VNEGGGAARHPSSSLSSDLSEGLRSLAAAGFDEPAEPPALASEIPAVRALPPLVDPSVVHGRRPPNAQGLAVADRILAAAGGGSGAGVPALATESPDQRRTLDPVAVAHEQPESRTSGQTTLAPYSAVVTLPTGESFRLAEGARLTIGRVRSDGIVAVEHVEVSRRHVAVEVRFGQVIATDLGSTNGTMVVSANQSRPLTPNTPTPLVEGDRLQIGADVPLCVIERIEWHA
jgi:hypothetical protein